MRIEFQWSIKKINIKKIKKEHSKSIIHQSEEFADDNYSVDHVIKRENLFSIKRNSSYTDLIDCFVYTHYSIRRPSTYFIPVSNLIHKF